MEAGPRYTDFARIGQKTPLPAVTSLLRVTQPSPSNGCFSGSTIIAFRNYVTIMNLRVP
jgi:hypothetical protein